MNRFQVSLPWLVASAIVAAVIGGFATICLRNHTELTNALDNALWYQSQQSRDFQQRLVLAKDLARRQFGQIDCPVGVHINDRDFYEVGSDGRVRALRFGGPNVDDREMPMIGQLTDLEKLTIDGPNITDAGLIRIITLFALRELKLSGMTLSDKTFFIINCLPNLRSLTLENCKWAEKEGAEYRKAQENQRFDIVETTK